MLIHGEQWRNRNASTMDVDRLVGWNFKRLRTTQELSQEEIALRLGTVDQAYISQLEAGERNPTARTLFKLATALGVSVGELFETATVPPEIIGGNNSKIQKSPAGRIPRQKARSK